VYTIAAHDAGYAGAVASTRVWGWIVEARLAICVLEIRVAIPNTFRYLKHDAFAGQTVVLDRWRVRADTGLLDFVDVDQGSGLVKQWLERYRSRFNRVDALLLQKCRYLGRLDLYCPEQGWMLRRV
jgi:hypothetical protein